MLLKRIIGTYTLTILIGFLLSCNINAQSTKRINIGYFEAGTYPVHSLLRNEFYNQLEQILPEDYTIVTIPEGFRSAEWNRDTSRAMAVELSHIKHLDVLIAMGPWVVHDLLEAGFQKPILAMHQFNPLFEGLLDSTYQPIAPQLTVHQRSSKIVDDLTVLSKLINLKRLGVLYFPSADEKDKIINYISTVGKKLGFEVVTAEGYNNVGTYAFYKAYRNLDKKIDALYLPPLWGFDVIKLNDFFKMLSRDKIPAFTSEGKILLEKGAFATNAYYAVISEARFNAVKMVRIIQGELPADLPVEFRSGDGLAVNNRTAMKCKITLPEEILNDFYVIEAPISEDSPYYSLNDAINRAITQNPGYLSQYDALEAASQAARQAYAEYLPQFYSTAVFTHFDNNTISNSRDFLDNDQYYTSINFVQQLFSLATIKSIQIAAKKRDLENINLHQAQLDLELGVSLAYLNYLKAAEFLAVNLNNRQLIEHNLEIAWAKNQLENGDTLDIIRLEDERYQATLKVIDAKNNIKIARVLLNALFNMPGNQLFTLDTAAFNENKFWDKESSLYPIINNKPAQEELEKLLVSKALSRNPLMHQKRLQIDIQKQLLSQNKARYFPTIGFQGSLNYSDRWKDRLSFEEEKTTWSVSGIISLPIFLGTDRIRERGKLKAHLSELEYQKDDASLIIMSNVQSELHQFITSANMMRPAYQSRKRAYQTLDLVVKKYSADKLPLINLLDVQENTLETDINFILTRFNYYQTMARLVHAIGLTTYDNYSNFREEFHRQAQN